MRRSLLLPALLTGAMVTTGLAAGPAAGSSSTQPTVTGLSIVSGPLTGGAHLVVHGNGFSHVRTVLVGRATAHVLRVTAHQITIVVPGRKAGRVDVRVITGSGESAAVKGDRFTYVAPPSVSKVTPPQGPSSGGTRVTVKGKNFTHVKAVLFGKAKGTKLHVTSSTTLLVTAPAHITGLVAVRVTTAYGTSKAVPADHFSYLASTTPGPPTAPPPAPPVITVGTVLPDAIQAAPYAGGPFTATSGTPPYRWAARGLPGGIMLSPSGVLSGTTYATAGLKTLRVSVTDSAGVTAAARFTLRVNPQPGQLYGWGPNASGTLGDGTTSDSLAPIAISTGLIAVSMCSEKTNAFLVKQDGSVLGWGHDDKGQVGTGALTPVLNPALVMAGTGVVSVACAADTAYALTSAGTVFTWGIGSTGETGMGDTLSVSTPEQIPALTGVVAIAAGDHFGLALRSDGTVLAWGDNADGELGTGTGGSGSFSARPVQVTGLSDIVQVATSGSNSYAVKDDGTLWAWGVASNGELGNGALGGSSTPVQSSTAGIAAVGISEVNAFAVTTTGAALAWGSGNGTGSAPDGGQDVPTAAPWLSQTVSFGLGKTDAYAIRLKPRQEALP